MGGFLEYVPGDSLLHRMNPMAKVAAALLISVACFCTSNIALLLGVVAVDFALSASCGLTGRALGLAKAVFAFSLVLAVVQVLTTSEGAVLVALPWGYVGAGGALAAVTTIMRLVAAAVPLFLVLYVTKLSDLSNAACKMLRVPYRYAFTFTSTVRFIPTFMNDMRGIMEAQTARGVEFDDPSVVRRIRLAVPLCVPLLISSVRKINSSAIAAEVRGFNLRQPESGVKEYPLSAIDALGIVVGLALVVLALPL